MNNKPRPFKWPVSMMAVCLAFLAAYTAKLPGNAVADEAEAVPRIVGGSVVPDGRYPFMAAVYFDPDGDGDYFQGCGGSVIAANWILTAAHCVLDSATGAPVAASEVAVLVGTNSLDPESGGGRFLLAAEVIPYPNYDTVTSQGDLALIRAQELLSDRVIALPARSGDVPLVAETATVAGWGAISEDGRGSVDLLQTSVSVVSHEECLPIYPEVLDAQANFCAGSGSVGGRDSCQGDSGGPAFVVRDSVYVQAGIVSYGDGCARPGIPGVYTRVSTYTDWIVSFVPDALVVDAVAVPVNDAPAASGDSSAGASGYALLTLMATLSLCTRRRHLHAR